MLTLIRQADVYAPEPMGRQDLLLAGERIVAMAPELPIPADLCEVRDAAGLCAVPGFIDGHVHLQGAGGEGGFHTRTPELMLGDAIRGGVTTLVGCLGTDGTTRSLPGLLAKVRALEEEGVSAWMFSGSYAVPTPTLTGSVETDLLYIDKVIGVGEVAIADHRSSQPSFRALARLAAETHRGGLLSGKAGLLNLHVGDGPSRLDLLERLLAETELPRRMFLPTHINRNPGLFEAGLAYARAGGNIDLTTSSVPAFLEAGEVKCSRALKHLLEQGVSIERITFTSDGHGSLPNFDGHGRLCGLSVGQVSTLFEEVRDAVREEGLPLETALQVITTNPARVLKLARKGRIAPGMDADLVLLEPGSLELHSVIARGRVMMEAGNPLVRGTFER